MAGNKTKILIVDDDVDFVASTRTILESKPYEVIVAYDANDGIQKARKENPDLILLDVIMPMKDGFSAAEQIKKDHQLCTIPVIMLTSFSKKRSDTAIPVGRGYELQADDYIEKPIKPQDLLSAVERNLRK